MVTDIKNLPSILPLIPLQGAVLFPKGQLPLPIISPKHFSAVADVWHTHRVIGIVQPLDHEELKRSPSFFKAGSAAKMTDLGEFDDGRLYVTVTGLCRFDITEDLTPLGDVRRARVDYSAYASDLVAEMDFSLDRPKLIKELTTYFKRLEIDADFDEMHKIPNEKLITALAMACPLTSSERQALLQCSTIVEQSKLLTSLIEMANKEPNMFKITCH